MQANTNSPFNVNGTPLDRSKYNADRFAKFSELAAGVPVEGNKTADEWKAISDQIVKDDEVSKDNFKAFQDLAKAAKPERTRIRKELAATGFKDKALQAQLSEFMVFEGPFNRLTESLRLSSARVAVEALAGSSFGPTGVIAAYQAYANLAQAPLAELVDSVEARVAGTANNVHPGNKVKQYHHEGVWQKMNTMLREGVELAKAGTPVEVNAQYYELTSPEFLGGLAANAEAGNKVRVNVDPGRLLPYQGNTMEMDDYPDKMRSILMMTQMKGDVGVTAYPVSKLLGDPQDLMHRKGLRVGNEFFLSGMNANGGSGENIDAGYSIEGPAARELTLTFTRDVNESLGASNVELYSEKAIGSFMEKDVRMSRRGLTSLMDALTGPAPAGTPLEKPTNFKELDAYAKGKGFELGEMLDVPADRLEHSVDEMLNGGEPLPVTDFTKKKVLELSEKTMDALRDPKNMERAKDISPADGAPQGNAVVSLADHPTQRETEMIMAIYEAEKFIKIPAFVMTKPVAAALVAKNNEMKAAGKDFEVKVLADPGIYPDGGTPNEAGIRMLEDGDIPVRWAMLPRCGWHDRKIHAKEMLTDKGEFVGSTNFSKKGMRENHEHSGVIHIDPKDAESVKEHKAAEAYFDDLWENFSYECNSVKLASLWKKNYDGKDKKEQIEDARFGVIRKILRGIEAWEIESGKWTEQQMESPAVKIKMAQHMQSGMDDMSAAHLAVRETLGDEAYFGGLRSLPSAAELKKLAPRN